MKKLFLMIFILFFLIAFLLLTINRNPSYLDNGFIGDTQRLYVTSRMQPTELQHLLNQHIKIGDDEDVVFNFFNSTGFLYITIKNSENNQFYFYKKNIYPAHFCFLGCVAYDLNVSVMFENKKMISAKISYELKDQGGAW